MCLDPTGSSQLLHIPAHRDVRFDPIASLSFFPLQGGDAIGSTEEFFGHSAAFSVCSSQTRRSTNAATTAVAEEDEDDLEVHADPNASTHANGTNAVDEEELSSSKFKTETKGSHVAFVVTLPSSQTAKKAPNNNKKQQSVVGSVATFIAVFHSETLGFAWAVEVPSHLQVLPNKVLLLSAQVVLFLAKSNESAASDVRLYGAVKADHKKDTATAAATSTVVEVGQQMGSLVALHATSGAETAKKALKNAPVFAVAQDGTVTVLTLNVQTGTVVESRSFTSNTTSATSPASNKKGAKKAATAAIALSSQTTIATHKDFSKQWVLGLCDASSGAAWLIALSVSGKTSTALYALIPNTEENWSAVSIRESFQSTFAVFYKQNEKQSVKYVTLPSSGSEDVAVLLKDEELLVLSPLLSLEAAPAPVVGSWFDAASGCDIFFALKSNVKSTTTPWAWMQRVPCHYGAPGAKELSETSWNLVVRPPQSVSTSSSKNTESVDGDNHNDDEDAFNKNEQQQFVHVYPLAPLSPTTQALLCKIRATPRSHSRLVRQWPQAARQTRQLIAEGLLFACYQIGTWNPAVLRTSLRHCTSEELRQLFTNVLSSCRRTASVAKSISFGRRCTAAVDICSQLITLHRQLGIPLDGADVQVFCRLLRALRSVGHVLGRAEVRMSAMLRHAATPKVASRVQSNKNANGFAVAASRSVVGATYTPLPWAQRLEQSAQGTSLDAICEEAAALVAAVRTWPSTYTEEPSVNSGAVLMDWEVVGGRLDNAESQVLRFIEEPLVR